VSGWLTWVDLQRMNLGRSAIAPRERFPAHRYHDARADDDAHAPTLPPPPQQQPQQQHPHAATIAQLAENPALPRAFFDPSARSPDRNPHNHRHHRKRRERLVVVSSPQQLASCAADLLGQPRLAVDVEHSSRSSYLGSVALLQISTGQTDYVIDVLRPAVHAALRDALSPVFCSSSIVKVLHGCSGDVAWLQRCHALPLVNVLDTERLAASLDGEGLLDGTVAVGRPRSYAALLALLVPQAPALNKRLQTSDWAARPLPREMLEYAASDVRWLLPLADALVGALCCRRAEEGVAMAAAALSAATAEAAIVSASPWPLLARAVKASQLVALSVYSPPRPDAAVASAAAALLRRHLLIAPVAATTTTTAAAAAAADDSDTEAAGAAAATGAPPAAATTTTTTTMMSPDALRHASLALCAWRDSAARLADEGVYHFLPDEALAALCRNLAEARRVEASGGSGDTTISWRPLLSRKAVLHAAEDAARRLDAAGQQRLPYAVRWRVSPSLRKRAGELAALLRELHEGRCRTAASAEAGGGAAATSSPEASPPLPPSARAALDRAARLTAAGAAAAAVAAVAAAAAAAGVASDPTKAAAQQQQQQQRPPPPPMTGLCREARRAARRADASWVERQRLKFCAKRAPYEQSRIYSRDGVTLLTFCDRKKALWYVRRGLAEVMVGEGDAAANGAAEGGEGDEDDENEDDDDDDDDRGASEASSSSDDNDDEKPRDRRPTAAATAATTTYRPPTPPPPISVRLLFQHRTDDQAAGTDAYYTTQKPNECVACGSREVLRFRVVPPCYRRAFPARLKSHRSHDVVLLCLEHHERAHAAADREKRALARELGVPLDAAGMAAAADDNTAPNNNNPAEARRAAVVLRRFASRMPSARRLELEAAVLRQLPGRSLDAEAAEAARRRAAATGGGKGEDDATFLRPGDLESPALLAGLGRRRRERTLRRLRGGGVAAGGATAPAIAAATTTTAAADALSAPCDANSTSTISVNISKQKTGHQWHGERVVALTIAGCGGKPQDEDAALHALSQRFRMAFVDAVRPQRLPPGWAVENRDVRAFGAYSVYAAAPLPPERRSVAVAAVRAA
jgi:ribonuclease D